MKQELLEDLLEFGGDDGRISLGELFTVMNHPKSKALLKKLSINRLFLFELQKLLFPKPDVTIPIKAVMDLMLLCRGNNKATVHALAGGFCFVAQEMNSAVNGVK